MSAARGKLNMRFRRRLTPRSKLAVLLAISCLLLLFSTRVGGKLLHLLQLTSPMADAASSAANAAGRALASIEQPLVAADEHQAALARLRAAQNQLTAQAAHIQRLEAENRTLTGIRDRGFTVRGRLIPARVVAHDALDWRESRWIARGSTRGVRPGQAVLSNEFSIALGAESGARDGLRVLAAETLIGVIHRTSTHTAQVRLLSDPATQMRVLIGRQTEQGLKLVDASFWLVGAGRGRIEVRDVDRRYVDEGVAVGDTILTPPDDPALPVSLAVGMISSIRNDRDNGLLRVLEVTPSVDFDDLRQVFVLDPGQ